MLLDRESKGRKENPEANLACYVKAFKEWEFGCVDAEVDGKKLVASRNGSIECWRI